MKKDYNESKIFESLESEELGEFTLEEFIRTSAQRMLSAAVAEEVTEYLRRGHRERSEKAEGFRGYRNGSLPERKIATSVGTLVIKQPRISDIPDGQEKFQSGLIKPYKRRSAGLDNLFPKLFVEGLATRDFEPALRALVGEDAPLSPSSISRLNKGFKEDFATWKKKRLDELEIVYVWVDGIHLKAGIATEDMCALVIIGADRAGKKHLLALAEGYRESTESWLEVLRDLKQRGLNAPAIAVADGALGFWAALPQVWVGTKEQLCWLHKTRNILNKLPKSEHTEATERLRAIYLAREENGETARQRAEKLAKKLIQDWRKMGYEEAAKCFEKAIERLFTMFEFPIDHCRHLRTTNPIESPFATVRLRTNATRRMRTRKSGLYLVFKLLEKAERNWQRLTSAEKLKEVKLPDKVI